MKNFIPIKLTAQNFRSIGAETSIDFTSLYGLSLIKGINNDIKQSENAEGDEKANNGSGKSTIIDAILFSLYGKTLRSLDNRRIINRSIGSRLQTFVRLEFMIGNDHYISEAFLNIKGKANPTVGFRLTKNGEPPLDQNTPQMKDLIENQVLGCPFDLFKSSVVISQSSYQNFYEMTKSQKVSYVEQLFKMTDFGEALKLVRSDLNAAKNEYNSANMSLGKIGERMQDLLLKNSRFDEEVSGRADQIASAIMIKKKAISDCESTALQYLAIPDRSAKEKERMMLEEAIEIRKNKLIKYNAALAALKERSSSAEMIISKHSEVLDVICPDCYQKTDAILNLTSTKEQICQDAEKIKSIEKAIAEVEKENFDFRSKMRELQTEIEEIRMKERSKTLNENQLGYLKNELESLEKQHLEFKEKENPFTDLIEKVKKELNDANNLMAIKSKEIKKLQLLELAFGDNGAKKDILADLASRINDLMKFYLKQLGANYTVIFDSGFDFEFVTQSGASDIDSFSSGERQRISLSTMFSFRDLIIGNRIFSNLCILDECIDSGIDAFGVGRVVDSIKSMSQSTGTKFAIVSHNKAVSDKFKKYQEDGDQISVITAVKTNDQTHYEVN